MGRDSSSGSHNPFENSEDFHAEAVRQVQRYRQVNPLRFMEHSSADELFLGNILQTPLSDDAGLWRVHVKVSKMWLWLSDYHCSCCPRR